MNPELFDVVIIGAGPSGASAGIKLSGSGLKVAIIDKDTFPRDKICGDALSPDILNQLKWIDPDLRSRLDNAVRKLDCTGVRLFSPDNQSAIISLPEYVETNHGYVMRRKDFDQILISFLKEKDDIYYSEGEKVTAILQTKEYIEVETEKRLIQTKILIGADGAHSMVTKTLLGRVKIDKKHYAGALRVYYKNVKNLNPQHIELHFQKEILPGYLWVFPLSENEANVGIGMLSAEASRKNANLKELLTEAIQAHPNLRERFSEAEPLEKYKGFGLPLGGKRINLSGDRFLVVGDAASVIDPLTGEGVANAIRSGRFAADHVIKAFESNDFSASFNKKYDRRLYGAIMKELKVSRQFQILAKYPWILNMLVRKLNKSEAYRQYVSDQSGIFQLNSNWKMFKFVLRFLFGK